MAVKNLTDYLQFESFYVPKINEKLKFYLNAYQGKHGIVDERKLLLDASSYAVLSKGKRIRPLLTLASFDFLDVDFELFYVLPCVLEFCHAYSLIYDDLPALDDDDFRRGELSCHKKYGEDIAILSGSFLTFLIFSCLVKELKGKVSSDCLLDVVYALSEGVGINGMIGGQVIDLRSKSKEYFSLMNELKTARLIELSVVLPAILLGKEDSMKKLLADFGRKLGILFQIVDDILDSKLDDLDKMTYISMYGFENTETLVNDTKVTCYNLLNKLNGNTDLFKSFVDFFVSRTN